MDKHTTQPWQREECVRIVHCRTFVDAAVQDLVVEVTFMSSETEWGLERLRKTNKQRELTGLNRLGTQQQRLNPPTVTPPDLSKYRVRKLHQRYIRQNSVPETENIYASWGEGGIEGGGHSSLRIHLWWKLCTLYLLVCHVDYRRRFRSLLLCPLPVERHYFPSIVDSTRRSRLHWLKQDLFV